MSEFRLLPKMPAIAGILLSIFAMVAPLSSFPWRSSQSDFAAVLAIFGFSLSVGVASTRNSIPIRTKSAVFCICALTWTAFDFGFGRLYFFGDMVLVVGTVCLTVLAVSVGALRHSVSGDSTEIRFIAAIVLCAATVQAAIAVTQVVAPTYAALYFAAVADQYALQGRAAGNMGQPNHLATLLAMGVVSALWLGQATHFKKIAVLWAALLAAMVALSLSRLGLVSVVAVALLGASVGFWRRDWAKIVEFSVVGVSGLVAFVGYSWYLSGLANYVPKDMLSTHHRLAALKQFMAAILDAPWIGYGWLSTARVQDAYVIAYPSHENLTYAHNIVLDALLWFGVPVTLLVGVWVAAWLWRRVADVRNGEQEYPLLFIVPFLIHSLLEYPYAYGFFVLPVALVVGWLGRNDPGRLVWIPRWAWISGLLLALLFVVLAFQQYIRAESDITLRRLERLGVGQVEVDVTREQYPIWDQLGALAYTINVRAKPGLSAETLSREQAARFRYPFVGTILRYSAILAKNGQPIEARRQIEVMRLFWLAHWDEIKGQVCEASYSNLPELRAVLDLRPPIPCAKPE